MVEELNVIDAAGPTPDGRVGLMMFEHRDWTDIDKQVQDLQKKAQTYFSYVVDGDMVRDNPSFANKLVWFRLVCQVSPPAKAHLVFAHLQDLLSRHRIEFQVAVFNPADKNSSVNDLISIQRGA